MLLPEDLFSRNPAHLHQLSPPDLSNGLTAGKVSRVSGGRKLGASGHSLHAYPMQDPMPVGRGASIPLREISCCASRSSGPGGQHANVTASRIEAVFEVGDWGALSDEQKRRATSRLGPSNT